MFEIISAHTPDQVRIIRDLFREYEHFLQVDLCFQHFEEELAGLPGKYVSPEGALLLAMSRGKAAGCVAVRPLKADICEMKRLYVRPAYLRQGLGRKLASTAIERANTAGYTRMRLDTLKSLQPAISLYTSLGFKPCPAYYANPLPGVVYLELIFS